MSIKAVTTAVAITAGAIIGGNEAVNQLDGDAGSQSFRCQTITVDGDSQRSCENDTWIVWLDLHGEFEYAWNQGTGEFEYDKSKVPGGWQ